MSLLVAKEARVFLYLRMQRGAHREETNYGCLASAPLVHGATDRCRNTTPQITHTHTRTGTNSAQAQAHTHTHTHTNTHTHGNYLVTFTIPFANDGLI